MSSITQKSTPHEIKLGIRDSFAAGLGIFPLGIALGMLVIQAGLSWWIAPVISLLVFAGSVEFLLIAMFSGGASLFAVGLTTFVVNFRHVFYAFSFPLHLFYHRLAKSYAVFALIDEVYATYAGRRSATLSAPRILAMQLACHIYWVVGGLIGVAIAVLLPFELKGFDFALCALFTVMTLDAFKTRQAVPSAILAALSFTAAVIFNPANIMLTSLLIFTVLLITRFFITKARRPDTLPLNTALITVISDPVRQGSTNERL